MFLLLAALRLPAVEAGSYHPLALSRREGSPAGAALASNLLRRTLPGGAAMTRALAVTVLVTLAGGGALAQEGKEGSVVLSVEDYRALRDKAYPPDPEPPQPPVEAALSRLDYELKVEGDTASGLAHASIEVYREGHVAIPLPDGLLLGAARLDGRPVALLDGGASKAGPRWRLLLSRTGPAGVDLDVAARIQSSSGTESLSLPGSAAPLSRVVLVVPRTELDVTVTGGLLLEKAESAGTTRIVAAGRSGETLVASWRRRRGSPAVEQPLRFRGRLAQLVAYGEDSAQVAAEIGVSVVAGQMRSLEIGLPEGLVVNQVSGAAVADWSTTGNALAVTLLEPAQGEVTFSVQGELRAAREGALAVPLLRLPRAEREDGAVAVEVLGAGQVTASDPRALEPADASEVGGPAAGRDSPSMVAFRYRPMPGSAARSLGVQLERYTPQEVLSVAIEEARYRVLAASDGQRLVQARWAVRGRQRSFLAVRLPSGATAWSATVDGRPVRPGRGPDGQLLLPLPRQGRTDADSAVELTYVERGERFAERGRLRLTLPSLDAPISRTGCELHHPPQQRLSVESGPLRLAPFTPPLAAALRETPVPASPAPPPAKAGKKDSAEELSGMISRFRAEGRGARSAGTQPVLVPFPEFGPSIYLASELTAEGTAPTLDLSYERVRR
jgi:hypothetical protein